MAKRSTYDYVLYYKVGNSDRLGWCHRSLDRADWTRQQNDFTYGFIYSFRNKFDKDLAKLFWPADN